MLENLNKTPRNFYGGTHRNFQVKRISKLHFPRSTLQTLNSGLSRFETGLGLILKNRKSENQAFSACRGQKNTKIKRFEKFAYNAGAFFFKAILLRSKIKNNKAPYPGLKPKKFLKKRRKTSFTNVPKVSQTNTHVQNTHPFVYI